jgi:hypothetical protein
MLGKEDLAMTELKASEFENGYFGEKKLSLTTHDQPTS